MEEVTILCTGSQGEPLAALENNKRIPVIHVLVDTGFFDTLCISLNDNS